MSDFEHVVITRFNVRLDNSGDGKGTNPDWLLERFKLFETFCYPSLLAQTNQKFKWLVLFDEKTPEPFRAKALSLSNWKNYLPEFVDFSLHEETGCPPGLIALIGKHVDRRSKFLITTRIDNDDAVSTRFVELVQNHFAAKAPRQSYFHLDTNYI